ncbi:MAG: cupin domain-containing protein [Prosthecobacter sp.]|uniref:1,2-dihydroxy-3-keto-5-methylthiopentene dioxygenase n=1 Tax=Prosthecobacter sp. TaxID=1965333 RepID=UPI0025F2BF68|nr:cupin domain-containing protein [Prosthecobacter sp.]MCF7785029.1 cupin domain-containing protein [Prosthecobacter sp.]
MAYLRIPAADRVIDDADSIRSFLLPHGIHYDRWQVAGRIDRDASQEEILAAYAPEVEELMQSGGYITADVVNVTPTAPNLQEMLNKFNQEHRHAEDEVRFIVKGHGIFFIHPENGDPVFSIELEEGDFINVPAGTKHWFDLCADRTIRAIRLFREKAGWTPLYTGDAIASGYQPLCFGPNPMAAKGIKIEQAVSIAA